MNAYDWIESLRYGIDQQNALAGLRVLVVEDGYDPNREVARVLTDAGADVDLECHERSACEKLARSRARYDAAVCRFLRPERSVADLYGDMRSLGISVPLVAIVSGRDSLAAAKLQRLGCKCVVLTPAEPSDIVTAVREAADERRGRLSRLLTTVH